MASLSCHLNVLHFVLFNTSLLPLWVFGIIITIAPSYLRAMEQCLGPFRVTVIKRVTETTFKNILA